jgi:hypothetical protein
MGWLSKEAEQLKNLLAATEYAIKRRVSPTGQAPYPLHCVKGRQRQATILCKLADTGRTHPSGFSHHCVNTLYGETNNNRQAST